MREIKFGRKWIDFERGLPRLFLHEKNETRVRWLIRALTATGIAISVVSLPWFWSLSVAFGLVGLDWFLERTLFYYSSMYVDAIMEDYDPNEWVATVVISIGKPDDPESAKIVGLAFKTAEYANRFFDVLNRWNDSEDESQNELCLTFILDEDMYYVYLYSLPDKTTIESFKKQVEDESKFEKFGKEHFMLVMQQIFCKGFETTKGFALGMFLDNHPSGKEFLLAPYIFDPVKGAIPIEGAKPIVMREYKAKAAVYLDQTDYEYYHWLKVVNRSAEDTDA